MRPLSLAAPLTYSVRLLEQPSIQWIGFGQSRPRLISGRVGSSHRSALGTGADVPLRPISIPAKSV